jgi:hypothetical protein
MVRRVWAIGSSTAPNAVKTNMAKTTGWALRGDRLVDHAPLGYRHTQTFNVALRHDRLHAPWVIDGPINRDLFDLYIEAQLAPTLQPGDVINLDYLSSHKSPEAEQVLKDIGFWFLPLPKSPSSSLIISACSRTTPAPWGATPRCCTSPLSTKGRTCCCILTFLPVIAVRY